MPVIRAITWNVRKFGGCDPARLEFVRAVVLQAQAHLVLFQEGTSQDSASAIVTLATDMSDPRGAWQPFGSEVTGAMYLRATLSFKTAAEVTAWAPDLAPSYDAPPPGALTFTLKPPAARTPAGDQTVMYTLQNRGKMRGMLERYLGMILYDEAVWRQYRYFCVPGTPWGLAAGFGALGGNDPTGQSLGFLDPNGPILGRAPMIYPFYRFQGPNYTQRFPIVSLHAPFEVPVPVMDQWQAAVRRQDAGGVAVVAAPAVAVCGDFNVDALPAVNYNQTPPYSPDNVRVRTYAPYVSGGFDLGGALPTSIKAKWNPAWTTSADCYDHAYDHVLARGLPAGPVAPQRIDCLGAIAANAPWLAGVTGLPTGSLQAAFTWYRANVSDHVPVVTSWALP